MRKLSQVLSNNSRVFSPGFDISDDKASFIFIYDNEKYRWAFAIRVSKRTNFVRLFFYYIINLQYSYRFLVKS